MILKMVQKRVYIYRESNQPENGWFKACFICYTTTAQSLLFDEVERNGAKLERLVYVCPDCKRALRKDNELRTEYERKVRHHLRNY